MTTIKYLPNGEVRVTGVQAFALMTPEELNYLIGELPPRYPVPTKIGTVEWYNFNDALEIYINDCDVRADPRMCIAVLKSDGTVVDDQPNTSPNYR